MARKTETRTRLVEEDVERTVVETEVTQVEEEYEVVTCDWCEQSYTDDEDVKFIEFVQEPSVNAVGPARSQSLTIADVLSMFEVFEASGSRSVTQVTPMVDDTPFAVQESLQPSHVACNDVGRAFIEAIKNEVGRRGGPRARPEMATEAAFALDVPHNSYDEPEYLFQTNVSSNVSGTRYDICEYCHEHIGAER